MVFTFHPLIQQQGTQDTPLPVCPGRPSVSGYIDLCTSEHAVLLHDIILHLYVFMCEWVKACSTLSCSAAMQHISPIPRLPPSSARALFQGRRGQSSPSVYPEAATLNLQTPNLSAGKAKRRQHGPQQSITTLQLHDNSNPPASRHDIQLIYWENQLINKRSTTTVKKKNCPDSFKRMFQMLFF